MNKLPPIAFRLTIGITGHRSLEISEGLRPAIQEVVKTILQAQDFLKASQVQLCALSPLAEGADRLVAQEILDHYTGASLKAVLPFNKEDYLEDFPTEKSRAEFNLLLQKSSSTIILHDKPIRDEYPAEILKIIRDKAYENVGKFIADHCDVLIALWDQTPAKGQGGTADTVQYAFDTGCPIYIINPNKPAEYRYTAGKRSTEELSKKITEFNKAVQQPPKPPDYVTDEFFNLLSHPDIPEARRLPRDAQKNVRELLFPWYKTVSACTNYYQKIYRTVGLSVFWLAFSAVAIVGFGVIFLQGQAVIFCIEFLILCCISCLIHYGSRIKDSHKKWMQYRFLAERLRSSFFLALCGAAPSPSCVDRRPTDKGDADWMSLVFEEIWSSVPRRSTCTNTDLVQYKQYILKAWIDTQIAYHENTCKKTSTKSRRLEITGEWIFYGAISIAFVHFALPGFFSFLHQWIIEHCLVLASLLLPALAATIEAIRYHRSYEQIATRSRRMILDLKALKNSFDYASPKNLEKLLQEAEQLMLKETKEWLSLMSLAELYRVA